jgi:hypothetical protein
MSLGGNRMSGLSREKRIEGIKRLSEKIMSLSDEEVNILPSGMEFVAENRRKIQPKSEFEKQAEGFNKAFEMIEALTEEEINMLPSGLEFEKEYRIKWRDTSDIDKKLDEML